MSLSLVAEQLGLAALMFLTCMLAGALPLRIVRRLRDSENGMLRLSLLALFAGGVFMATCFLDIFPDIQANWQFYQNSFKDHIEFPLPYLLNCCGFLLVLLLEELLTLCSMGHMHADSDHEKESGDKDSTEQLPVVTDSRTPDSPLRWLTFTVVISVHSLLEGIALGVQNEQVRILSLFISLLLHKAIEAFSVGLVLAKAHHTKSMHMLLIAMYSFMTPVGVGFGVLLQELSFNPGTKAFIIALIEATAGGTFLFITFIEIIAEEMAKKNNGFLQLASIASGVALIVLLQIVLGMHE